MCEKCGRPGPAAMKGRTALCRPCLFEWTHLIRESLPFDEWLNLPPAVVLVHAFRRPWPDSETAAAWQEAIRSFHRDNKDIPGFYYPRGGVVGG